MGINNTGTKMSFSKKLNNKDKESIKSNSISNELMNIFRLTLPHSTSADECGLDHPEEGYYGKIKCCECSNDNNDEIVTKYFKLTDETIEYNGHTLHRIQCTSEFTIYNDQLKDDFDENNIGIINVGDFGGFIESESNLQDNAWVADNAKVYGNAVVCGHALVAGNAVVNENAIVRGSALVFGNAIIAGHAEVFGNSIVTEKAHIKGYTVVCGDVKIYGNTIIKGHSNICGKSKICNFAVISDANIENSLIFGEVEITGKAHIYDIVIDKSPARFHNDAYITNPYDYICFNNVGSRNDTLTAYHTKHDGVRIVVGCFFGDLVEFRKDIAKKGEKEILIKKEYELIADIIQHRFVNNNTKDYSEIFGKTETIENPR